MIADFGLRNADCDSRELREALLPNAYCLAPSSVAYCLVPVI
jgi:hypothetical protein